MVSKVVYLGVGVAVVGGLAYYSNQSSANAQVGIACDLTIAGKRVNLHFSTDFSIDRFTLRNGDAIVRRNAPVVREPPPQVGKVMWIKYDMGAGAYPFMALDLTDLKMYAQTALGLSRTYLGTCADDTFRGL